MQESEIGGKLQQEFIKINVKIAYRRKKNGHGRDLPNLGSNDYRLSRYHDLTPRGKMCGKGLLIHPQLFGTN